MRIFLSYSTEDIEIVRWIASQIQCHADVYYWDESKILGEKDWETIYHWIDSSNLVIAVITDNTVRRGISVGQEIGRAVAKNITVIPLITQNVSELSLGCLKGITYQRLSNNNLSIVIQNINNAISRKKQEQNQVRFVLGGILLYLLFKSND